MRFLFCAIVLFMCVPLMGCEGKVDAGKKVEKVQMDVPGIELKGTVSYWRTKDAKNYEMVFLSLDSGRKEIYKSPFNPSTLEVLKNGDILTARRYVDGGRIVSRLYIFDRIDRSYEKLSYDGGDEDFSPKVSGDKQSVAFYSEEDGGFVVKVLNMKEKKVIEMPCPGVSCTHPAWDKSDERLISVLDDKKVIVYSLDNRKGVVVYELKDEGFIPSVIFHEEDGNEMAIVSIVSGKLPVFQKSKVVAINMLTGREKVLIESDGAILRVIQTNISDVLLVGRNDRLKQQSLYVYNTKSGKETLITDPEWMTGEASWFE